MPTDPSVFLNGTLVPRSTAHVAIDDLGFLIGDGAFETLRSDSGVPTALDAHLDRLFDSLRVLAIEVPSSAPEIATQVERLLEANELQRGVARVRITVTRGPGSPRSETAGAPTLLVTAENTEPPAPEVYGRGVEIALSAYRRHAHPLHRVKSTSWQWSAWQRREAPDCYEVVQLNDDACLAEGSFTNVFLVDAQGTLRTPHPDEGCLPGVTRAAVLRLAQALGLEVREGEIDLATLRSAREIFLTGSLIEVMPVRGIEGRLVGGGAPGPVTLALQTAYAGRVRGHRSTP